MVYVRGESPPLFLLAQVHEPLLRIHHLAAGDAIDDFLMVKTSGTSYVVYG